MICSRSFLRAGTVNDFFLPFIWPSTRVSCVTSSRQKSAPAFQPGRSIDRSITSHVRVCLCTAVPWHWKTLFSGYSANECFPTSALRAFHSAPIFPSRAVCPWRIVDLLETVNTFRASLSLDDTSVLILKHRNLLEPVNTSSAAVTCVWFLIYHRDKCTVEESLFCS